MNNVTQCFNVLRRLTAPPPLATPLIVSLLNMPRGLQSPSKLHLLLEAREDSVNTVVTVPQSRFGVRMVKGKTVCNSQDCTLVTPQQYLRCVPCDGLSSY